ncbi:hypothetical protein E5288_WYG014216 [Bos mutus]|uniref:Uncharacterized protein n=1 Tax=Bos mutus TaxID=72004 RepID=A0A6B0R5S1_9CETA|nr:hypothetical protein [Bos mutus]
MNDLACCSTVVSVCQKIPEIMLKLLVYSKVVSWQYSEEQSDKEVILRYRKSVVPLVTFPMLSNAICCILCGLHFRITKCVSHFFHKLHT